MAARKAIRSTSFLALGFGLLGSASAGQEDRAFELLRKSMGRRFAVNIVAVIQQRDPGCEGNFLTVKVSRAKDGRARLTTVQPLSRAGSESVDDGEQMRWYLPDTRTLVLQDSPAKVPSDNESRLVMIRKNYLLSISGKERIAGRETLCVVADPRDPDMPLRRFYIDQSIGYPLRLEVSDEGGGMKTVFDTKAIEFPAQLQPNIFEMTPLPGTHTIRYARPQRISTPSRAVSSVGFRPIVPQRLPYGFQVQEIQYNGGKDWKSVVVRITDGLAKATVYQWKPGGKPVESFENSSAIDVNGIRLMIASDLPGEFRARILQAFANQVSSDDQVRAQRLSGFLWSPIPAIGPRVELIAAIWTFAQLQDRGGLGQGDYSPGIPVRSTLY